jgi:hypothetical protein
MELARAQRFYGLCYDLLVWDFWGLCFEMKEPTEEIWQCISFILLAREEIFLRAEIRLETLKIDQDFFFEMCP